MENLRLAYIKSRRGKSYQDKVKKVDADAETYLEQLHDMLINETYHTSEYKTKIIKEPKVRTIYILPYFPDRILHHAIMNVLEPIWDNRMTYHSYSCRQGKGQHKGSKVCMNYTKRNKYCFKCDISKFYPNINHEILKKILRRKIKCKKTLKLLDEIIDSIAGEINVPVGNYLSQWFGNLYMNEFDDYVKHSLRIRYYIRYCDDFCIYSNNKKELQIIKMLVAAFLRVKLKLKLSKCDIFPTTQGVDFLGYRHFPKGYLLARKTTARRVKRRFKKIIPLLNKGKINVDQAISIVASTKGWLKHCNSYNLIKSIRLEEVDKYVRSLKDS